MVIKEKIAHGKIEQIVNQRLRGKALSLNLRIGQFHESITRLLRDIIHGRWPNIHTHKGHTHYKEKLMVSEEEKISAKMIVKTYHSIRIDFIESTKLNYDSFNKLFPLIKLNLKNRSLLFVSLETLCNQCIQMLLYLRRFMN